MEFKAGDHIKSIYFCGTASLTVGATCDDITVIMERGQMSLVPWFAVWKGGVIVSKWNAAHVEGVILRED